MLRIKTAPQTKGLSIVPTPDGYLDAIFMQNDSGYIVGDYDYGTKKEFEAWKAKHGTKEENPKRGV
tara:strand:+ start:172 stop:369 length:198 start_codon:yes stop_codon:yes gene_type:complete